MNWLRHPWQQLLQQEFAVTCSHSLHQCEGILAHSSMQDSFFFFWFWFGFLEEGVQPHLKL